MVSIIKNQLLKHLSRFTKNLSADKINLSTFKGEGELSNLELDEIVLTDLLELPSWLRLTRAWCNRVQFRISWTKLKTVPIYLNLDEVNIIVETCEELRSLSSPSAPSSVGVPGKYSFIHKVIDGITISVNTVNVTFNSPAFTASVQISRILVESKSTSWQRSDLRMTRLKDSEKGQILIFKELEWQTVRIEAKSTKDKDLTPLRLLTNHARCRITIKKRLSDCFIMGSRLVLILDDLLWVLTDSQLKAALHFLDSLADLVAKATEVTRKQKAARKLEVLPEYQAQKAQQARTSEASAISKIFSRYDVVETSYHFVSQHIVLHLCDDPGDGRSFHPNLKDGGALQISCHGFQVDYYPYHLAMGDRKHWPRYKEGSVPHTQWLDQSLNSFRSKFIDLIDKNRSQHVPLSRSPQQQQTPTPIHKSNDNQTSSTLSGVSPEAAKKPVNTVKNYVLKQLPKLMTTCIIMRIEDFTLYRVTTSGKKQALKEFISGDRDHISLPEETNIVHAEFTYYYYPGDIPFPLPPPKFYVQLNPIQIHFDIDSCLWFNSFALNLHQSLITSKPNASAQVMPYIDVKIEAILPRVVLESNVDHHGQRDRPKSLHVQVTRATITNVRSLEHSSRADLAKCVDSFHMGSLFFGTDFPSQQNDYYIVTQKFLDHISATDNVRTLPEFASSKALPEQFSQELLWTEAKDVWCINLDPVWADFYGARSVGSSRPIPFLDAVPITVWLHLNLDNSKPRVVNDPKTADIHALAYISNLVSVQLNHYQYLFLLRMAEDVSELATFLAIDSNRILKQEQDSSKSIAVGALIPQVEVTFVMPSQCPGKESSGGDLESVLPDSSSIGDDILVGTGSGTTLWQQSMAVNEVLTQNQNQTEVRKTEVVFCEQEMSYPTLPIIPEPMTTNFNKSTANGGTTTTTKTTTPQSSQPFPNIPNNINAGLSSMKKGFSSLMTSIDSALKSSPDDLSDTLSIRSDASSDSENYVVVNLESGERNVECMDAMFRVQGVTYDAPARATVVEMASEVIEDDNSATTPSEHSLASTYKRRDLVSVSTFKLSKVEFLQQSVGFTSNLKIQVSNVVNDECGAIPWDEFQSKFSSRSRAWVDIPANSNTSTKVKLRLDHDVIESELANIKTMDISNKNHLRRLFKDTLNIQINDIELDLNMSTVIGLADLTEDEIFPVQIPMQISLDNIQLHLIEDRPPSNITSPGPIPIDLTVKQLFINKDMDGVFHISPLTSNLISSSSSSMSIKEEKERERELQTLQHTVRQLKTDSDELKRRLAAFDRISEENRQLRKTKEEADILRACLTSAQDDIAKLIEDKKTLLDNLQRMEEHFRQTERSRQWTTKR